MTSARRLSATSDLLPRQELHRLVQQPYVVLLVLFVPLQQATTKVIHTQLMVYAELF